MTAFGLTIEFWVKVATGWPAAFALAVTWARSGPMVALVPAALKVWQPPHPDDTNTDLPAAAFPATGFWVVVVGSVPSTVIGRGDTTSALPQAVASNAIPTRSRASRRTGASLTMAVPPRSSTRLRFLHEAQAVRT